MLVSAHFDHDGVNGTQILNGADDNGRERSRLLEIADAMRRRPEQGQRPKRSVLFCRVEFRRARTARRLGLHRTPLAPLENMPPCSTWT